MKEPFLIFAVLTLLCSVLVSQAADDERMIAKVPSMGPPPASSPWALPQSPVYSSPGYNSTYVSPPRPPVVCAQSTAVPPPVYRPAPVYVPPAPMLGIRLDFNGDERRRH